jgi:hypothetical protein
VGEMKEGEGGGVRGGGLGGRARGAPMEGGCMGEGARLLLLSGLCSMCVQELLCS